MSSSPPDTLGQYQIIREIARSNDIVYEGYDPAMNRRVAVKELAFPGGSSTQQKEDRIKRFLREAKAAGSLVHPNIVTVYNVAEQDGRYYLAMEYLDGQTLRKRIDDAPIDQAEALEIAIEILKGLAFAHANGVVHRDVKPENIQILEGGAIKLTDFGIARLTFEPNITMDGQVFGTPSYMSPEQINGRDIDPRSDLFSLGIVLYEMLAGSKPFKGDSVVAITHAIMNFDPQPLPHVNHTVWSVLNSALEKSPQLRPGSAEQMIAALKQALRSLNSPVLDPIGVPPQLPPDPYAGNTPYTPYGTPNPFYSQGQTQQGQATPAQYSYPAAQPPGQTIYAPYAGGSTGYLPPGYPAQPYGGAPQTYGSTPGYGPPVQIPVYYPPPPRKFVINPAATATIAKFFAAVIVIGAMAGLILVVVNALGAAGAQFTQPTHQPVRSVSPAPTKPDRKSASGTGIPARQQADPASADTLISQAVAQIRRGADQSNIEFRNQDWKSANEKLAQAIVASPQREASIKQTAVQEYAAIAESFAGSGQYEGARSAYYQALSFAASETQAQTIRARIEELGG